jgi:iron only hydrogenase large subunit-like protein
VEELTLVKEKYSELFKEMVKAYYRDSFEEKVEEILNRAGVSKEELSGVISSLCGVKVPYDEYYINNLRKAISVYEINSQIVEKVHQCGMGCSHQNGKSSCQLSCPFDAIVIDPVTHNTRIDSELCANCGVCVDACENGHIMDKIQFIPFAQLLKDKKPIIAAVAPAIMGQFGKDVTIDQLRAAFKKVGFIDMVEVAFFADMLTLKEAVEFDIHVKNQDDLMITSCCCPMWVGMLKRVYNDLVKHVSPSVSPMIASGRVLKALNPDVKVVFIGPCIAKKAEAKEKDLIGDIDYVLTFDEVRNIFEALDIVPGELEGEPSIEYASKGGRIYGRTGGVSVAVADAICELFPEKYKLLKAIHGNGVKECKDILTRAQNRELDANFIEGMGCVGGCVGGPKVLVSKEEGTIRINNFGEGSDIKIATQSDCMNEVLRQLGINSVEDFRNHHTVEIFERNF